MRVKKHEQWRKSFPYFKVQYWDYRASAWHDVQKHFDTEVKARAYGIKLGTKYRVMIINRDERRVI